MARNIRGCGVDNQPQRMLVCECETGMRVQEIVNKYSKWVSVTVADLLYRSGQIIPGVSYENDLKAISKLDDSKRYIIRLRSKNYRNRYNTGVIQTKRYGKLNVNVVSQAIVLMKKNPYRVMWDDIYD